MAGRHGTRPYKGRAWGDECSHVSRDLTSIDRLSTVNEQKLARAGKRQNGRVMDDCTSESPHLHPPSVASVLGVKGGLRFRRHGASQKAHVVLRRVEISEDAPYPPGRAPVAYFSLFAQKRIEVKPGKEILLSVASEDGSFTDQAVIFEGDLSVVADSNSDEEEEVEKQIAHDDTFSDPPVPHVIPPKMRRTWTKQHEQVSSVEGEHSPCPSHTPSMRAFGVSLLDAFAPPPPIHVSVGVQVQPTWSVSAVQAVPPAVPVQEKPQLQTHKSPREPLTPVKEPVRIAEPDPSPKLIPPPDDRPVSTSYTTREYFLNHCRYRLMSGPGVCPQ